MNETMQAILERRSIRHYTEEPVSEDALSQIIEAGLWAPHRPKRPGGEDHRRPRPGVAGRLPGSL